MRKKRGVVVALVTVLVLSSLVFAEGTVSIQDFQFSPQNLEIEVGETVTWTNDGQEPHTVTGGSFSSGDLANGDSFSHTFNEEGNFPYQCDYPNGMTGSIVVNAPIQNVPPQNNPPQNNPAQGGQAVSGSGCYVFFGGSEQFVCQQVQAEDVEEDCARNPGCSMNTHFVRGSDCSISECELVTCSVDCQEHAEGVCEALGGTAVSDDEYDALCTLGCCKIERANFCQFGLIQSQCELKAKQRLGSFTQNDLNFNYLNMNAESCNRQYCEVKLSQSALSGFVFNEEGEGISGAELVLEGTGKSATSTGTGSFTIPTLNPGSYLVTITKEGFVSFSQSIQVAGEKTEKNFTLTSADGTGVIQGTVSGDGELLDGATLSWTGPTLGSVFTDAGQYAIPNLPEGTYTVTASKVGYSQEQEEIDVTTGPVSKSFNLEKIDMVGVSGTTYIDLNDNGHADPEEARYGVRILINGNFKGFSEFEPKGRFFIDVEGEGPHTISATYQNYEYPETEFEIGEELTLLLTAFIGECSEPGTELPVTEFSVSPIPGQEQLQLQWTKPCAEVIGYTIERMQGDVVLGTFQVSPIDATYIDQNVEWGTDYTYQITAQYDQGRTTAPFASSAVNVGNRQCEGRYKETGWETFCIAEDRETEASERKTVFTCTDENQIVQSLNCADRDALEAGENYFCAEISPGVAECKNGGMCSIQGQQADPFGLYYSRSQCYGTANPEDGTENFCVYDYTDSIVDQCTICTEVDTCFDYKGKDACEINNCLGSKCQWVDGAANEALLDYSILFENVDVPLFVSPETGKGYCVEEGYDDDDKCSECGPTSDLFGNYYCTAEVCSGLGRCFSNPVHKDPPLTSCFACQDNPSPNANCYMYSTELECTGGRSIEKSPFGEITVSEDQCGWSRCKWDGIAGGAGSCIKDGNVDGADDCSLFTPGENAACRLDNTPPRTTIQEAGIPIISLTYPSITFHGDDRFHEDARQRSALSDANYCLVSTDPRSSTVCRAEDFISVPYPGLEPEQLLEHNLVESFEGQKINGKTYLLKYYSLDKYFNQEDVQETFVYVDNVVPEFEIEYLNTTIGDVTDLQVFLQGAESEPMACTFALTQIIPLGETQTASVPREQREKTVEFIGLNGIRFDLNVTCIDDQGNENNKQRPITFDLQQDIELLHPALNTPVAETEIAFEVATKVGATCSLHLAGNNQKVADFNIIDEEGKQHQTPAVPGFVEREYATEYKVVCKELHTQEQLEDYFHFEVDFTPPATEIILTEGLHEERFTDFGWEAFFVETVAVDFDCSSDGFACEKTYYCLGEVCDFVEFAEPFTVGESTRICYYSDDVAGNTVFQPVCGEVVVEGFGLNLDNPVQHYYNDEIWGISNTATFDWQFFTKVPTQECRFDFTPRFSYDIVPGFKVLTPNADGKYIFTSFPEDSGSSPYAESGGVKRVYVKCKDLDGQLGPESVMNLEYDPTAPEIQEATVFPNPLLEGVEVELSVGTDDKTLCKFSDSGHDDYGSMNFAFPGGEADLPGSEGGLRILDETHKAGYTVSVTAGELVKQYQFKTMCMNGAGDTSEVKSLDLTVDYSQLGGILSMYPDNEGIAATDILATVETSKNAVCEFKSEGVYLPMEGAGTAFHSVQFTGLNESAYQVPIKCRMGDHVVETAMKFTVDLTPPVIGEIDDGTFSCGSDVAAMVSSNEANLTQYYYEVYDQGAAVSVEKNDGPNATNTSVGNASTGAAVTSPFKGFSFFKDKTPANKVTVDIKDNKFAPLIEINVGDTVVWENKDDVAHTATADDGSFDSKTLQKGGKFEKTFNVAGEFKYTCGFHPNMKGTVVVKAAGTETKKVGPATGQLVLNASVGGELPLRIPTQNLVEGNKYVVRIRAGDLAGNWGDFSESDGFTVVPAEFSACEEDDAAPEVQFSINDESCSAVQVEMRCKDTTACKEVKYGTHLASTLCQAVNAYNGQKLAFDKMGWVCYYVEDTMGNNYTGEKRIAFLDNDGDKISNKCDKCSSTSPGKVVDLNGCADGESPGEQPDTDKDGLPDFWEMLYSQCGMNYLSVDADANGVHDPQEDFDNDEFTAIEEFLSGQDPCEADRKVEKKEEEEKPTPPPPPPPEDSKTLPLVLLIMGILSSLGGVGYLIYFYKFATPSTGKPAAVPGRPAGFPAPASSTQKPVTPKIDFKKRLTDIKKVHQDKLKHHERRGLFRVFGKEKATPPVKVFTTTSKQIPHIDPILQEKPPHLDTLKEVADTYTEHKDVIKPGLRGTEKGLFDKLENISNQTKQKKIHKVVSEKEGQDVFAKLMKISSKRKK